MGLETRTEQEANTKIHVFSGRTPKVSDQARILIVSDDEFLTERLESTFRNVGLVSESAGSMTAGCTAAKSGRFQVVFTTPLLADGSWRRLADIATHYGLGFATVLLASDSDFNQCAQALEDGAFDVVNIVHEWPRTAEAAKSALWAAYLRGTGPCPEGPGHPMAA
jgi:DNA-binding NtrC family response regulator